MDNSFKKAKLTFAGGTGGPTGSNFLFEADGKKILVDCGLEQGSKMAEDSNSEPFIYDPATIDFLFVTHAHLDHIGRIPLLVKNGFSGKIYSSTPTQDLITPMYDDAVSLLAREAEKEGKTPIYGAEEVKRTISLWKSIDYGEVFKVSENITVVLRDAGHILGSAMFEFRYGSKKILFTGDLGNSPSLLLRDTETVTDVDYLIMESVYGDRAHENRNERADMLKDAVKKVIKKKGVLILPIFSLERTQDIIFELNNLVEKKKIPVIPVFLDSPLAIKITEIYKKNTRYFNDAARKAIQGGDNIFNFPKFEFTTTVEESKGIRNVPSPKIIMAGSGMSNGGRILFHERDYLPDHRNALLLVGYQAAGTLGRLLIDGQKKVKILGEEVKVKADVSVIDGYSAHRDINGLTEFVENIKYTPERVFVTMGEPKASMFFAQRIHDLFGIKAIVPKKGESFMLEF